MIVNNQQKIVSGAETVRVAATALERRIAELQAADAVSPPPPQDDLVVLREKYSAVSEYVRHGEERVQRVFWLAGRIGRPFPGLPVCLSDTQRAQLSDLTASLPP